MAEMLSIPFQQTARYLKYYPKDVSKEEFAAINAVLSANTIGQRYLPYLSDPVKATIKTNDRKALSEYLKAWYSMLLKHPTVYLSATIAGTCNYFYLDANNKFFRNELYTYTQKAGTGRNNGRYKIGYWNNSSIRNKLTQFLNQEWPKLPILGLVYYPGVYTWVLMALILFLVRAKLFASIIPFIPSVMTLLFCLASPVNGSIRYMLPVIASIPLLLVWTLYARKMQFKNKITIITGK